MTAYLDWWNRLRRTRGSGIGWVVCVWQVFDPLGAGPVCDGCLALALLWQLIQMVFSAENIRHGGEWMVIGNMCFSA